MISFGMQRFPRRAVWVLASAMLCIALVGFGSAAPAAGPRILPEGKLPADKRLAPLKDLNGYFPFTPAASKQAWNKRAEQVRRRMLVSQGLWPMPSKTPLNAVIHGRIDRGDFTVEKVYFESFPGFYVTGTLYRPKNAKGKIPGVLCPHGHWANGRFYDAGVASVRKQITQGAERFEEGGRNPIISRSVQLARMGCVVFSYDMIGYADSQQISFDVAHRFAKQRPEMNTVENWGLFSPQAESHVQSVMGMQTYDSVRALDFITSLSDVDPSRIAVTGASGGGTQTFMISAIDSRVAVSMPAVMVSTAMQGGCTCENASCLRIGTGNVEIAALFAPKPLGLTAANDWTKEMQTKGFPELQQHFKMLGVPDNVMLKPLIHFGHNYNYVSRAAMYGWMNKHLKLGHSEPIIEENYDRLTPQDLTVWDEKHPKPAGGADFEQKIIRWWHDDAEKQLAALTPSDEKSLGQFREIYGGAIDTLIGRTVPEATDVEYEQTDKVDHGDYLSIVGLLRTKSQGEELPIVFLHPKQWDGHAAIWVHEQGKAGLFKNDGQPNAEVSRLLAAGVSVVGVDLLYQGEFLSDGQAIEKTRKVANPREFAGYSFGFNDTLFARRVHDILSVVAFVRAHEHQPKQVSLIGLNGAGRLAAAARAQARDAVDSAAIDTAGFRFGKVLDIHSPDFLPGGAKYGDLPGFLAVSSPDKLWLSGEGKQAPALVAAAYKAAGAEGNLTVYSGPEQKKASAAVDWLLK